MLNRQHMRLRFERAAATFDTGDFVHAATRASLLTRLEPLRITAQTVVDLGAATGAAQQPLKKRFKAANIVAIDIAHTMLQRARKKKSWLSRTAFAQASADALPFRNACIDVVFANLLLPWIDDTEAVFSEIARILRPGGVFAFATLGPDSLQEISRAWGTVDDAAHVMRFPDMHNIGDELLQAGLRDPVLDVDQLSVSYRNSTRLFADLTAVGGRNALQGRARTLTGKQRFAAMLSALDAAAGGGAITLDLELVYGHCWGAGPKTDPSNYRVDASQIPLRRR